MYLFMTSICRYQIILLGNRACRCKQLGNLTHSLLIYIRSPITMPTHNFAASTLCLTSFLELFKIELAPKKTTLRVAGAGFVHTRCVIHFLLSSQQCRYTAKLHNQCNENCVDVLSDSYRGDCTSLHQLYDTHI